MLRNDFVPSGVVNITLSDTAPVNLCGLVASAAGNVAVVDSLGNATTIAMVAGQTINAMIVTVKATGTTIAAANLVGLKA